MAGRSLSHRAAVAVGVLVGVAVTGLAVTGVLLLDRYQPGHEFAGENPRRDDLRVAHDLVVAHQVFAVALATLTLVVVVAVTFRVVRQRLERDWTQSAVPAALAVLLLVVTAVATSTGFAIAWEQVGFSEVTVGTDLDAMWTPAFGDDVTFVVVDGAEISQGEFARNLVVHLAVVPLALLAVGIAAVLRRRRARA
jgi:quinol-cytochrome oxidoreductase complex cytochrome b subunit